MLPLTNRHNIIASLVPDNPKPGQIITMPEGQVLGASNVISVFREDILLGDALQFSPIPNVSGKSLLTRVTSHVPLAKGMRIRVLAQQFSFTSAIFIQYFGWMGHDVQSPPTVTANHLCRIEYALRVGPESDKFFIYEKICLTNVEEKK